MLSSPARLCLTVLLLLGLPLVSIWLSGEDIRIYTEFPPLTRYVAHAPFNWGVFYVISMLNVIMIIGLAGLLKAAAAKQIITKPLTTYRFPAWGWIGLLVMLVGWCLAWSRYEWFSAFQKHTFTLPWIGYILAVNAWSVKRSGRSPVTDTPVQFALLWPASAVFWWYFEYLNRFVQNWHYLNVEQFGPLGYFFFASLAFSTVLPAVLSTLHLLLTWPIFFRGLTGWLPIFNRYPITTALTALVAAGGGLIFMGVYPDYLYPLVWCAPLAVIIALQSLWDHTHIFSPLARGDWCEIVAAPIAALICGFFWELWNIQSLAQWRYSIPFVGRFHLFAMPLLGYGGYLPFGLMCLAVGRFASSPSVLAHR